MGIGAIVERIGGLFFRPLAIYLTLFVGTTAIALPESPVPSGEHPETLTVIVRVGDCLTQSHVLPAKVPELTVVVSSLPRQGGPYAGHLFERHINIKAGDRSIRTTFQVQPDAYYVGGNLGDDHFLCNVAYGTAAVVLPGHPVTLTADLLYMMVSDNLSLNYVAGLVDPGLKLTIYTSLQDIPCDSKPDTSALTQFGSYDAAYTAKLGGGVQPNGTNVLAAIDDGTDRALVVLPMHVVFNVGQNSSFLRFDATRATLDRFASVGGAIAHCFVALAATPSFEHAMRM